MNNKDPSNQDHDKKYRNKTMKPGQILKINFGDSNKEYIKNKKYKNSIFLVLKSILGVKLHMHISFTSKMVRRAERTFELQDEVSKRQRLKIEKELNRLQNKHNNNYL